MSNMNTDSNRYAKCRHKRIYLTGPEIFDVDYILGNVVSMLNVLFII